MNDTATMEGINIERRQYPEMFTASGDLSAYALACGYVQKRQLSPDFAVTLFREHNIYVVYHRHDRQCFDNVTDARQAYRKAIHEYGVFP